MTFLFDKPVFGPIHSRRLGVSLGVNLLPTTHKICSFDCLYCECGSLHSQPLNSSKLPSRELIYNSLHDKLKEMSEAGILPNAITFAGNGEPTLHPNFEGIIDDTIVLRDKFAPNAKVSVLSNATQLHRESVVNALGKVNDCILKIDAGNEETISILNQPNCKYSLDNVIKKIKLMGSNLVIQTMFVKWNINGKEYDNTDERHVNQWLEIISLIKPPRLMIYTIDRDTPLQTMWKISKERLDEIGRLAQQFVPSVSISY